MIYIKPQNKHSNQNGIFFLPSFFLAKRKIIFEVNKIDILEELLKTPFARKNKHKNMEINKLDNSSMIPI